MEKCDQFATHAVREAVKAAGAFRGSGFGDGRHCWISTDGDLAADRAGAAIARALGLRLGPRRTAVWLEP